MPASITYRSRLIIKVENNINSGTIIVLRYSFHSFFFVALTLYNIAPFLKKHYSILKKSLFFIK